MLTRFPIDYQVAGTITTILLSKVGIGPASISKAHPVIVFDPQVSVGGHPTGLQGTTYSTG
jgi:hypothetical protein